MPPFSYFAFFKLIPRAVGGGLTVMASTAAIFFGVWWQNWRVDEDRRQSGRQQGDLIRARLDGTFETVLAFIRHIDWYYWPIHFAMLVVLWQFTIPFGMLIYDRTSAARIFPCSQYTH